MATVNITEGTSAIRNSRIIKEDRSNTDILTLTLNNTTVISVGDTLNYKEKGGTTIFSGIVEKIKQGKGIREIE